MTSETPHGYWSRLEKRQFAGSSIRILRRGQGMREAIATN
jgi:hypothetical protein